MTDVDYTFYFTQGLKIQTHAEAECCRCSSLGKAIYVVYDFERSRFGIRGSSISNNFLGQKRVLIDSSRIPDPS